MDTGDHPRTTEAEERELARRIAAGDKAAIERLVLGNARMVWSIARRYMGVVPLEDAVQEGMLGLHKAARRYDGRHRFGTYAMFYVRKAVGDFVCGMSTPLSFTRAAPGKLLLMEGMVSRRLEARGIVPTEEAIAAEMKTTVHAVRVARGIRGGGARLDAPIAGKDGEPATLADFIAADAPSPEDQASEAEREAKVRRALGKLDPRSRRVLLARADDEKTLTEIGEELRISRERVRQIEGKAMRTLKWHLEHEGGEVVYLRKNKAAERHFEAAQQPFKLHDPPPPSSPPPHTAPPWVSLAQACEILGCTRARVYALHRARRIAADDNASGRRYERASLEAYLASRKAPNPAEASTRRRIAETQAQGGPVEVLELPPGAMTVGEAAVYLRCSKYHVHHLTKDGRLHPVRHEGKPYYRPAEIAAYRAHQERRRPEPRRIPASPPPSTPQEDGPAERFARAAARLTEAKAKVARLRAELAQAAEEHAQAAREVAGLLEAA